MTQLSLKENVDVVNFSFGKQKKSAEINVSQNTGQKLHILYQFRRQSKESSFRMCAKSNQTMIPNGYFFKEHLLLNSPKLSP